MEFVAGIDGGADGFGEAELQALRVRVWVRLGLRPFLDEEKGGVSSPLGISRVVQAGCVRGAPGESCALFYCKVSAPRLFCRRAQATTLAVSLMETWQISWLVDVEENVTIVDKASAWLAKHKAEIPERARRTTRRTRRESVGHGPVAKTIECFRGLIASFAEGDDIDEMAIDPVRF